MSQEKKTQAEQNQALTPVPALDFAREYAEIGAEIAAAVGQVFSSQRFILGPQVAEFEQAAAVRCGANFAVGCSSGTDALWLALAATGVGSSHVVVTTPFSFFATASAILRAGARPVFADIDPATFNLSPECAKNALKNTLFDTKKRQICAILPVHLYGQPADWDGFTRLKAENGEEHGEEHGLTLIEDAAQAFGAAWRGRPVGSLGDAAAFSFYPTKNLSAAGEAGMVTASSDAVAERVRMLRTHGMRRRYYHDELGWNSRLDTIQAAVLLVKLRYIDEWNQRRRAIAARYGELFAQAGLVERGGGHGAPHGVVLPYTDPRATHVFHQYVIRVGRRDELRAFLTARGIGSEIYYPVPLHEQQALRDLGYKAGAFPESERAAREVLALPIYPQLRDEEQEIVVDAIAEFVS